MSRWALGDKFNTTFPHKGSVKILWETRWKFACTKSIYPFHDGNVEDFEPVFQHLIENNINDPYTDAYTNAFMSSAQSLEKKAEECLAAHQHEEASNLLKRAAVVYRISRFPYVSPSDTSSVKRAAFEQQKKVYMKAASFWNPRITEVKIPHKHRVEGEGETIPLYLRIPPKASLDHPVPTVLLMTGLDGYRPDNFQRTQEINARGWATVICEIPGTADCPSSPADPASPDRLWDSVLDYINGRPEFDSKQVMAWGLSAGGFYAIRAAHTHRERLVGCIAHGAGSHFFLDEEWLSKVNDHEYPFEITPAWAEKYGFKTVDEFIRDGQKKFSLVETNIVQSPSCRLLLLNGVNDGVVPIEDSTVLFNYGSPKEGRFAAGLPHMGYPDTLPVAYDWMKQILS